MRRRTTLRRCAEAEERHRGSCVAFEGCFDWSEDAAEPVEQAELREAAVTLLRMLHGLHL